MTVKELIEELEKMPPYALVVIEGGSRHLDRVELGKRGFGFSASVAGEQTVLLYPVRKINEALPY